jgi:hypothetical protein
MKGFMSYKITEFQKNALPINDRWVKGGWLFIVSECKKVLWFYKITIISSVFDEGEF